MKLEEAIQTSRFGDEVHKATINVLHTAYWLKSSISGALKDEHLSAEQFNVLRVLRGKHPEEMCVKDIKSRLIERNSNVPRIVDRLVAKNLVKRRISDLDKRETLVSLTDEGTRLLARANNLVSNVNARITGMDNGEARMLSDLLDKMREHSSN